MSNEYKVWENQEAIEFMTAKLVEQRVRSIEGGDCLYNGPNGTHCGIGWLIPDEAYKSSFEGVAVFELEEEIDSFRNLDSSMLESFQYLHDDENIEDFQSSEFIYRVRAICLDCELDTEFLNQYNFE